MGVSDHQDRWVLVLTCIARSDLVVFSLDCIPSNRNSRTNRDGSVGRFRFSVLARHWYVHCRGITSGLDICRVAGQGLGRNRIHSGVSAVGELLVRAEGDRTNIGITPCIGIWWRSCWWCNSWSGRCHSCVACCCNGASTHLVMGNSS